MALTEDQMNQRQKSIGGSDIPAILGISPFKTAADIFIQKTQQVEQSTSPAIEAGHKLESAVINWAMDKLKINQMSWSSANVRRTKQVSAEGREAPAHANLDFMFIVPEIGRCGLEAKTTSVRHGWGTEWTDEVPDHVLTQCLWQAEVADLNVVYVAVLLADRGFHFKMYEIDPDDYEEELQEIRKRIVSFWNDNVMEETEPEEMYPALETLQKVVRTPSKSTKLAEDVVKQWLEAKDALSEAQKSEKSAKEKMLNELKDAEEGQCSLGTLTYLEYDRKGYEVEPTKYRQLKWRRKD